MGELKKLWLFFFLCSARGGIFDEEEVPPSLVGTGLVQVNQSSAGGAKLADGLEATIRALSNAAEEKEAADLARGFAGYPSLATRILSKVVSTSSEIVREVISGIEKRLPPDREMEELLSLVEAEADTSSNRLFHKADESMPLVYNEVRNSLLPSIQALEEIIKSVELIEGNLSDILTPGTILEPCINWEVSAPTANRITLCSEKCLSREGNKHGNMNYRFEFDLADKEGFIRFGDRNGPSYSPGFYVENRLTPVVLSALNELTTEMNVKDFRNGNRSVDLLKMFHAILSHVSGLRSEKFIIAFGDRTPWYLRGGIYSYSMTKALIEMHPGEKYKKFFIC
jgi:hypothetical protein